MARHKPNAMLAGLHELQVGYGAAKRSGPFKRRRCGVPPQGAGADWHYSSEADFLWMGEVARDLDRNDVVIGQMIDRATDNILQSGFTPNPNTGDEQLDADLKARAAEEFADPRKCDAAGQLTFHGQERMVLRETYAPGDCFVLPMQDGTFQILESHLCRSPSRRVKENVVHGVEMDPRTRERLRYWFTTEPIDPLARNVLKEQLAPLAAYDADGEPNVLHVYFPRRPSQTRGVTALAPVIDVAGMHDDLQFAALLKAQLNAFFLLVRNRTSDFDAAGQHEPAGVPTDDPYDQRQQEKLAPGAQLRGMRGENIQPWSPNIPNAEFFPHIKLVLTFLGINVGLPLVLVLLDASETNFSGFRGALDQARLGFESIQFGLKQRFHAPYWRAKVRFWASEDHALARALEQSQPGGTINVLRHTWDAPGWRYIEPGKDAAADLVRLSNMLTSPTRIGNERGMPWEKIVAETIRDRRLAIEGALQVAQELNKTYQLEGPAAVNWRDLAPLPAPERVNISMIAGDPEPQPEPKKNDFPTKQAA